jgi:hypothetical protein
MGAEHCCDGDFFKVFASITLPRGTIVPAPSTYSKKWHRDTLLLARLPVENHYPCSLCLNERRAGHRDSHCEWCFSYVLLILICADRVLWWRAKGGVLDTVHCFGGAEACGIGALDGGGLARGTLVCSSISVSSAVVAGRIPLPSGTVVTIPTPPPPPPVTVVWYGAVLLFKFE